MLANGSRSPAYDAAVGARRQRELAAARMWHGRRPWAEGVKRAFDLAFAGLVLLLAAPVIACAAAAIWVESPGRVFFRQDRMGRYGKVFRIVKLRGMYSDAPQRFAHLSDYESVGTDDLDSFFFHIENDPRVTKVGRFLRKHSIDELPNFWNVLRGEMSVVGPRPEIPELAHLYGDSLAILLSVRPGVTSPAKCSGRDERSLDETIAMDLEYVAHWSFSLDLKTVAQTAWTAVCGSGVRS
jgi:exopolysaccharide production protein ExoY